jgi:hypothetical protein
MGLWTGRAGALVALLLGVMGAAPARAENAPTARWLPNAAGASWTYAWSDSAFNRAPTFERYTVKQRTDSGVSLAWSTDGVSNGPDATPSQGTIDYAYTDGGIVNTTWSSTAPPPQFPVLCASVGQCGNSMAGAHYAFVWGTRSPLLQEPLVQGAQWRSVGGQGNDVASMSRYLGRQRVVVPAFPNGVFAAAVESDITQAGAIGDPYGSVLRTTWWVYGVGPVKSVLRHTGGEVTSVELQATNLSPLTPPSDRAHLPLIKGDSMRFRYTNSKHMKRASVQQLDVTDVANNTARVDLKSVSGPIRVAGSYVFTTRNSGVTNIAAATQAATRVAFPPLGPRAQPAGRRRHFFTVLDLMDYGFNPILKAFPKAGASWQSSTKGRDFRVFGATGTTKVIGTRTVTTPAGRFSALLVQSTLRQSGFPFGSGVRRAWYAPGVGLVKLEFRHGDGSVSRVVRLER